MTVGEKLIRLRGERTQQEVANALGISDSAMSAYECDARTPRDEIKVRIAEFYHTSVQEIFFED